MMQAQKEKQQASGAGGGGGGKKSDGGAGVSDTMNEQFRTNIRPDIWTASCIACYD